MVGIFDSGLGGLSVLTAVRAGLPNADLLYVADQARAPYGDRSLPEVLGFAREMTRVMIDRGTTTTVLASGTISNAALHALRTEHPGLTFVGLEPAVKPAVAATRTGVIAVLATTGTITGPLLADMIERFAGDVRVLGVPLPGLVELIEDGLGSSPHTERFLAGCLVEPIAAGADVYVLACTHYPFARPALERLLGDAILIDPAEAVARQVERVHPPGGSGRTVALTTGDPVRFHRQIAEVAPNLVIDSIEGI
jgi:glutamate racemase